MGKSSKRKKNRVPKITEAEYAAYLSALKAGEAPRMDGAVETATAPSAPRRNEE